MIIPAFIDWQPDIELFRVDLPVLGVLAVRWYSLMWIIGLVVGYLIVQRLFKKQGIPDEKFEPLFFYCFISILIGARLGHCIFYEPEYYLTSRIGFWEMLLPMHHTAEGWKFTGYEGLASHGGTIGLFLGLWIYSKRQKLGLWTVVDNIAIATPFTCFCIRIGNLMNSEIIGKVTDVPWAFIFHTNEAVVDGMLVPRHPAQLYEAIAYLIIFFVGLWIYSREKELVGTSFYFGYCVFAIFFFRFFVEFVKKEQVAFEQGMTLDMGQLLSIPFVIIAAWAMWKGWNKKVTTETNKNNKK